MAERKFRLVTITTVIKVYEEDNHKAQDIALDRARTMEEEDYIEASTFTCSTVRTEDDEDDEFALINEEYNVWGYAMDSRTFSFEARVEGKGQDWNEEGVIDLDDYPIETICGAEGISLREGMEFVEVSSDMTDIQIASLVFIQEQGL